MYLTGIIIIIDTTIRQKYLLLANTTQCVYVKNLLTHQQSSVCCAYISRLRVRERDRGLILTVNWAVSLGCAKNRSKESLQNWNWFHSRQFFYFSLFPFVCILLRLLECLLACLLTTYVTSLYFFRDKRRYADKRLITFVFRLPGRKFLLYM